MSPEQATGRSQMCSAFAACGSGVDSKIGVPSGLWWFTSFGYFPALVSHHSILFAIPVLGRVPSAVSFPSWDGSSAVHILPSTRTPEEPPFQKDQLDLGALQENQLWIQGHQLHWGTVEEILPVDVYKESRGGQRFDHQQLKCCSGSRILQWDHSVTPCIKLLLELLRALP